MLFQKQVFRAMASGSPQRAKYVMGWVIANEIIGARYREDGIDVIPVFQTDSERERFLITRRVSCRYCAHMPGNEFGYLSVNDEYGPTFISPGNDAILPIGTLIQMDTASACAAVLDRIPAGLLMGENHDTCLHHQAKIYPSLYAAVTRLLISSPDVVAAREVHVGDQAQDGEFHPIFLHTAGVVQGIVYDWFAIESLHNTAFIHISGAPALYRRRSGNWAAKRLQYQTSVEAITREITGWLEVEATV